MSIERIQAGPRMSQAVKHGNMVYLAGQVAANPVPSVAKQTKQILSQIDKLLKAAGTSKKNLVTTNIWRRKSGPRWAMVDDASCFENNKRVTDPTIPEGFGRF